nr:hypothetical protein [Streptomyces formicae]
MRCPEAGTSPEWGASLNGLAPDATMTTRAYTGRLARAAPTPYLKAWTEPGAADPALFPDQLRLVNEWRRGETRGMDRANHWAGQSAALATEKPAAQVVADMWREACELLA